MRKVYCEEYGASKYSLECRMCSHLIAGELRRMLQAETRVELRDDASNSF